MTTPDSTDKKTESQRGSATFPKTQANYRLQSLLRCPCYRGRAPAAYAGASDTCVEPVDKLGPKLRLWEEKMLTGEKNIK